MLSPHSLKSEGVVCDKEGVPYSFAKKCVQKKKVRLGLAVRMTVGPKLRARWKGAAVVAMDKKTHFL